MNRSIIEDWELLGQFSQEYRTLADTFMSRIDMHRAQAMMLCRLYVRDGMTQSEIADELSVQGATVTNIVQRLEEAEMVERRRDAEDSRLMRVYLTAEGKRRERAITEQFSAMQDLLFEGVSDAERALLRRILVQMQSNIQRLS